MEQSFIPKKQMTRFSSGSRGLGLFSLVSLLVFLASLGLFGGVFFYQRLVSAEIQELEATLDKIKADFEPALVDRLIRTSKSIEFSKEILSRHRAASNILLFLGENTLKNAAFSNFRYSDEGGRVSVSMRGEAESYTEAARQAAILENSPLVEEAVFSNFSLTGERGNVGFDVSIKFKSSLSQFKI